MMTQSSPHDDEPLILAIDIGTSSVRATLFDRVGREINGIQTRRRYKIKMTSAGASEVNPDHLLERVWKCVDDVIDRFGPEQSKICGVATCTFVANILGIDHHGTTLTPLITYADTRSQKEVVLLRETLDEAAVHDRTGCYFHTSYLPALFCWFARTQPKIFNQVARWISIGEYMALKLFGEVAASYSVASWTGLLDRKRLTWDEELLSSLPVSIDHLSSLTESDQPQSGLRPEFAHRWEALKTVPWFPAVADGAAANIGSACHTSERVALTIGTSSAMRVATYDPINVVPAGLWCYRVDGHRYLVGGALNEGGSLFAWMNSTLMFDRPDKLESALSVMVPDGHGLTVLPFLSGERSPGWVGHARATIHGLSQATTPLDILRAGLEAVAYRIFMIFERLTLVIPDQAQVIASGGALRHSPAWLQMLADVLGQPITVSDVREASGRGAALLALENLGVLTNLDEAPSFTGKRCLPNQENHAIYREAIERQRKLYDRLIAGSLKSTG